MLNIEIAINSVKISVDFQNFDGTPISLHWLFLRDTVGNFVRIPLSRHNTAVTIFHETVIFLYFMLYKQLKFHAQLNILN